GERARATQPGFRRRVRPRLSAVRPGGDARALRCVRRLDRGLPVVFRPARAPPLQRGPRGGTPARAAGRSRGARWPGGCLMDDHAPLIERAFAAAPEECSYLIRRVE